jgi:DNA-binding transcriptional MocR family regulator
MVKMVIRWSHLGRLHFALRVGRYSNVQTPTRRYISVQDSLYAQTHTTPGVINFGLGQPSKSLLPLELFQQAAAHRFQPSQDAALLQYGAGKGYLGYRKALARFLSGKGC